MRSIHLASLALVALSSVATAQGCLFLPDADPAAGPGSIHPFGDVDPTNIQTANQCLLFEVPRSQLPNRRIDIRAIGFASEGDRVRHFDRIAIRLGTGSNQTLQPLFSQNMPGFTSLVADYGDWTWTTPADGWSYVGLFVPFPYDPAQGDDLIVQIITAGAASTGTGPTGFRSDPNRRSVLQEGWRFQPGRGVVGNGAPKVRICWDANDLQTFGGGCAGSNGLVPRLELTGSSRLGQSFTIGLRDVPASTRATILMLGRLRVSPLDLTGFGAPGCAALTFFEFNLGFGIQGGSFDLPLTLPNDAGLNGVNLWTQWIPVDLPANPLGVTGSNLGRILIGS